MDVSHIKRVLFLTHPESDYGGAFLFNGLCQYFGPHNVFDFPIKTSYHGETHAYHLPGRPEPGQTGALPWMLGTLCPWSEVAANEPRRNGIWTDALIDTIKNDLDGGFFDLVVIESLRLCALEAYHIFERHIGDVPVVVHDGEDYEAIHPQLPPKTRLLLKREMLGTTPSKAGRAKIVPFPFSFPFGGPLPVSDKHEDPLDVVFMAGRTCDFRQHVADALRSSDLRSHVVLSPDMPRDGITPLADGLKCWSQYLDLMARSTCAVSVRGFGYDTCRAWEVPACTAMVRDKLPIFIPHDFVHAENAMLCATADQFVQSAKLLRDNPQLREEIFTKGQEHLRKYHTNLARASYMMEQLAEV